MDDSSLMAVEPGHRHLFRVRKRRWFTGEILLIIDLDRIGRIQAHDPAVFDIHRGHAVDGGRNQVGIIEADRIAGRDDGRIPVGLSIPHTQMPFPDGGRGVARRLHHLGKGIHGRVHKQRGVAGQDAGFGIPPGVHARKKAEPAGGGRRRGGIGAAHQQPFRCKAVDVRRPDRSGAVAAQVADSQVVCNDEKDIGTRRLLGRTGENSQECGREPGPGSMFHNFPVSLPQM